MLTYHSNVVKVFVKSKLLQIVDYFSALFLTPLYIAQMS